MNEVLPQFKQCPCQPSSVQDNRHWKFGFGSDFDFGGGVANGWARTLASWLTVDILGWTLISKEVFKAIPQRIYG